ncbi:helix-turn-helix domain-containing protein [Lactococcus petauri]|jgi:Zn-dependent peptidase ImmA (M78 family)/DNA-binding XRE family transcriptional regulator|uniref:spr1629 family repressor/antitoxin n=2 Tax=Lactococcus petauri TaxID=1940789 RepID=UPI0002EF949F|nr:XRE family transcriptional regulator [Lactococcus petauri]USI65536.1 XRE family transcriptional regulator [Lactococcus petauri]
MFNGEKLTELRLLYGWTRLELADKLNITEQAVWQFETGKTRPKKVPTVLELSRLFGVEVSYFENEMEASNIDMRSIAFRNEDNESRKTIQMQEVYVNKIDSLVKYLESFLITPDKSIYSLIQKVDTLLKEKQITSSLIKEVADLSREKLAISNNNNDLLYRIELSGVNVLSRLIAQGSSADAYSLWSKDNVPYIVLGIGKSAVRRNFDLAHELGHLLLHRTVDFESIDKEQHKIKEQEANLFASELLMPEEHFRTYFERFVGTKVSQPDNYIELKQYFNVSIQALEYRAYKLGYLSVSQNSYFFRQIYQKGYKKIEPLDKDIVIKKPGKIVSMIDTILSNNLSDLQSMLYELNIRKQFLSNILNIDASFFDRYSEVNEYNNIIKFERTKKKA